MTSSSLRVDSPRDSVKGGLQGGREKLGLSQFEGMQKFEDVSITPRKSGEKKLEGLKMLGHGRTRKKREFGTGPGKSAQVTSC